MMSNSSRVQKRAWLYLLLLSFEIIMIWASLAEARPLTTRAQVQVEPSLATKGRRARRDGIKGADQLHVNGDGRFRELVRLAGSRPPNCGHKCGGCEPCMAIQVPTTTNKLSPQYANYEPEGWKCKCGSTFYNP